MWLGGLRRIAGSSLMRHFLVTDADELVFTEKFPFTLFALPNRRRPGTRLPVERITIRQRAIVEGEAELHRVGFFVTRGETIGRVGAAKNVGPMGNVAIGGAVISNQD